MRRSWRICVVPIACLVAVGCGTSANNASKPAPVPRGQPAHVRVANLSGAVVSVKIGSTYEISDIPVGELSTVRPVSPGKSYSITAMSDSGERTYDLATEPGRFATVVIHDKSMSGFVSGKSLSVAGAAVDLVNLTGKPLTFKVGAREVEVQPMASETIEVPVGAVQVRAGSGVPVEGTVDTSQIFGAYAVTERGVTVLRSVNLKGTGQPVSSGGPS